MGAHRRCRVGHGRGGALARRGARIQLTEVNGQPGALVLDERDRPLGVMGLGIAEGQIEAIHAIANPDKLRHFDRVGYLAALLRAGGVAGV